MLLSSHSAATTCDARLHQGLRQRGAAIELWRHAEADEPSAGARAGQKV